MDEKKIIEIILQNSDTKDNKNYLTCNKAFQIAKELDIEVSTIGQLCNQQGIKLKQCQVGCF